MKILSPRFRAILSPLAVAAALTACDSSTAGPAEPAALSSLVQGATIEVREIPMNVNFQPFSVCLNARVTLSGTAIWTERWVTKPDGSVHITVRMDVSGPTISLGGSVWTALPGASEMFVHHIPAGGSRFADERQLQHQGTVIYRSAEGRPDLRFVHRIHRVRLPGSDEVHLNHEIFEIGCVGKKNS